MERTPSADDKIRCLAFYKKAHEERFESYEEMIAGLLETAKQQKANNNKHVGERFATRAKKLEKIRDKSNFEDWYARDKDQFEEFDQDNTGFLERGEFLKFVKAKMGLSEEEASNLFSKWDVDQGGSVGPFEFVDLMSVWHTELVYYEQKAKKKQLYESHKDLLSDGCCGPATSLYCGCAWSLCTLGLSWIPFVLRAKANENRMLDPDFNDKLERAASAKELSEEANARARESVKKRLMERDSDQMIKRNECRESSVASK